MMQSKQFRLLISFLIALAAWIYVVYSVDPSTTKIYHDVPIRFANEQSLSQNGLALRSLDFDTVDVTVEARRSVLAELTVDNIEASIDLGEAGKGENTLDVNVTAPNNTQVHGQSEQRVLVEIEEEVAQEKPVRVEYADPSASSGEPFVTEQSEETFLVYGAETLVNDVQYVRIPITNEKVTDTVKTFSVSPVAIDNGGNAVGYVRIEPDKASAAVYSAETKEVELKVSVNNPDNDECKRSYNAPEKITIRGTSETLANVNSITTEMIDLSVINESENVPLSYDLPEGVQIANASVDATIFVKVTPYVTKEITIPSDSIEIRNLGRNVTGEIEDESVTVKAIGTSDQVEGLEAADFTVWVDANGLEAGEFMLAPEVETKATLYRAALEESRVDLILSDKQE